MFVFKELADEERKTDLTQQRLAALLHGVSQRSGISHILSIGTVRYLVVIVDVVIIVWTVGIVRSG